MRFIGLLYLLMASALTPLASLGRTLVVRPDGSGQYPDLAASIAIAAPGDTVLAYPGTYTGPNNRNLSFGGKDISVISAWGSQATTIDCEYSGRGFNLEDNETRAALIKGFHILHGGGGDRFAAGGVRCNNSSPTLIDIKVSESVVSNHGGIELLYSSAWIENCALVDNIVGADSGGLGVGYSDSAIVKNCVISGNLGNGYGGGISIVRAKVVLDNVRIDGNQTSLGGGGFIWESDVILRNCSIENNIAHDGAGIYDDSNTSMLIQNCTFSGNHANRWGGAVYFSESLNSVMEDCDVFENYSEHGPIICIMDYATPLLKRLSVVKNSRGEGIGTGCCYTAAIVEDCIVAFNRDGHGIHEDPSGQSWMTLYCSNVYGNEYGEFEGESQVGLRGNISEDPLFCDSSFGTLDLAHESPCLPENNDCGVVMGNHGGACTVTSVEPAVPAPNVLSAHPNPFNPTTAIHFTLDQPGPARLTIYDVAGREVAVLHDGPLSQGEQSTLWRADGQASGLYFARLTTAEGQRQCKLMLLK